MPPLRKGARGPAFHFDIPCAAVTSRRTCDEANHGCRTAPPNRPGPVRTHAQRAHLTPVLLQGRRDGAGRDHRVTGNARREASELISCHIADYHACGVARLPISVPFANDKRRRLLSRERAYSYQHGPGHHQAHTPSPPGRLSAVATPLPVAFQVLRTPFGTGIDRTTRFCAVVRALSHPKNQGPAQDPA